MTFEVDPAVQVAVTFELGTQGLAVLIDHPDVGGDEAHAALGFEQGGALFDERKIEIEVAALGTGVERGAVVVFRFDEILGHIGLDPAEVLQFHVGRIADDAVESAMREDVREGAAPVEDVDPLAGGGVQVREQGSALPLQKGGEAGSDQTVAAENVAVQLG